jgi:hypothetical protein
MTQIQAETIQFPAGNQARLIQPPQGATAGEIVQALGVPAPRALLVLNGGTAELAGELQAQLARLLGDGLARVVAEERITAITGATDAGVFALFGQGAERWGITAPCIGVTVANVVAWPGHPRADGAALEPHHTHFVLTAGETWGAETATMYALIDELARNCPVVVVFAGGGQIVIQEMESAVVQGRELILIAGSGRTTDAVLAARAGQASDDPRLLEIAQAGRITAFDINRDPTELREIIRRKLFL